MRVSSAVCLVIVCAITLFQPQFAKASNWPYDPWQNLWIGAGERPVIAKDETGGAVIAWADDRSGLHIYSEHCSDVMTTRLKRMMGYWGSRPVFSLVKANWSQ